MDWQTFADGAWQESPGNTASWLISPNSSGQAIVRRGPPGSPAIMAVDFAVCGSMAEARLLVAHWELAPPAAADVRLMLSEAGFAARPADTLPMATYRKECQPGSLEMLLRRPGASDAWSLTAQYVQANGRRWSTIVHCGFIHECPHGATGQVRESLAGHVQAALAVMEARRTVHGHYGRPLVDGEEQAFVADLEGAAPRSGVRPR